MHRTVPAVLVVVFLLAACAASGDAPSDPTVPDGSESVPEPTAPGSDGGGAPDGDGQIDHPAGSEAVIVISSSGGMLPVQMQVTSVPSLVITGDGRVVMQGMQTLEFPGPALPALIERRLTESGLQDILRSIEQTNLFTGDLELRGMAGMIADATDTTISVRAAGRESAATVYAISSLLPDMDPPPGMSAAELDAYRVLSTLHDRLLMLDSSLDADAWATAAWVPYQPEAFRLYVRDVTGQPIEGGDLEGQVRQWPTDSDPAAFGEEIGSFGDGTRCGVVADEPGATWLAELEQANQNTLWTDDGDRRFAIGVRPLLPHEVHSCPELEAG